MSAAKDALKAAFVSTKNEVMIMSNVLKESTADSINAAIDVAGIKSVATDVTFTSVASQRAANDEVANDVHSEQRVGSTDTLNANVALIKACLVRLDSVVSKREAYDQQLRTHNDSLYEILSDCYSMLLIANNNSAEEEALAAALAQYKKSAKSKTVQKHSTSAHVLVRFVFDESCDSSIDSPTRHSVSTYAIVLKIALERNITAEQFVSWVRAQGGIDKIRRLKHESARDEGDKSEKTIFIGALSESQIEIGTKITLHTTFVGKCRVRLDQFVIG